MKQLNRSTAETGPVPPIKVLQFGEGNFLRGFVDWIIDILNEKTNFNGSVHIVQPIENGLISLLKKQDCLYHVLLAGLKDGKPVQEKRLIKSVASASNPYDDYQEFLKLAENPDLEFIISNTTEAGISHNPADKDMAALPISFPGKLTALLYHRFKHFNGEAEKGLMLIPCELIEKNGETLKTTILTYCKDWDLPEAFITWINTANNFCNTLVDRIVPGFPKNTIDEVQEALNYEDNLVVKAEPFHLWVIEAPDAVKAKFPAEEAGLEVKFVKDLTPYRTRKVRILNGAHTTLVPVAYLQDLRTVKEAVEHEKTGDFVRKAILEEIVPTLDLPAAELEKFANDVIERFRNPFIRHELISIALNSISKFKVRVLPSVLEYYDRKKQVPERLLYSLAALIIFYRGEWNGETIALNDSEENLEFFKSAWTENDTAKVAQQVLSNKAFWGMDLTEIEGLQRVVENSMQQILETESVTK